MVEVAPTLVQMRVKPAEMVLRKEVPFRPKVEMVRQRMVEESRKLGLEKHLQTHITADERFIQLTAQGVDRLTPGLVEFQKRYRGFVLPPEHYLNQEAQLQALDTFRKQYPEEFAVYERYGVMFSDSGEPEMRDDIFYRYIEREADRRVKERLLAEKNKYSDPNLQLTAMAKTYSRIHFEEWGKAYRDYREKFPEKTEMYANAQGLPGDARGRVYFDEYCEQRLQGDLEELDAFSMALFKGIVMWELGEDAPKFRKSVGTYVRMAWRKVKEKMKKKEPPDEDEEEKQSSVEELTEQAP